MPFLKSLGYVALIGILAHVVGETLPRKWFRWERFPYDSWKWEKKGKIYDRLCIRAWKDRLPDKSRYVKRMVPKRVGSCPTSASVYRLVRETCVAETVHFCLCLLAFPIYFFWRNGVGVFLTLLFVFCNLPFMMIQRYNRPALVDLGARLERREERRRNAHIDSIGEHGRRA